jgi:hypothetical protein
MENKNDLNNSVSGVTSKRVRVKRSMLVSCVHTQPDDVSRQLSLFFLIELQVEHSEDDNKLVKPIQESNDFANDTNFTGIEDCDFVNRLRQPDR